VKVRSKLAAIASAAALAVAMGAVYAGPAAAMDDQDLCVEDTQNVPECAFASGDKAGDIAEADDNGGSATYVVWDAPPLTGQIRLDQKNTDLCLTIDYSSTTDKIVLETCAGASDQEWLTFPVSTSRGTAYGYESVEYTLCLNDKYYDDVLNIASCPGLSTSANEQWFPGLP
jgi:hypothetical protein